jgi:tRNA nucleotidyltransferase (CCA-adding enzyme)
VYWNNFNLLISISYINPDDPREAAAEKKAQEEEQRRKAKEAEVENPYFARECFEDATEEIVAAQKIAREIAKLSPDLRLKKYTEPKVLIVGGFVRDALSGGRPKDLDLEVSGVPIDKLVKLLRKIFGPDKVNEVGKSFGVLKVSLGGGRELDVAIPRVDSKDRSGSGHKNIKAKGEPALSTKEAQRRRDFSINALGMEVLSGSVIDSFGGVEDLKNKVLRLVDKETFKDDPLRVLRGVQFAAPFGLVI